MYVIIVKRKENTGMKQLFNFKDIAKGTLFFEFGKKKR